MKIDIPSLLVHLRGRVVRGGRAGTAGGRPAGERLAMRALARVFSSRRRYERAQSAARVGRARSRATGDRAPRSRPAGRLDAYRDLRAPPAQTFRDWWRERDGPA